MSALCISHLSCPTYLNLAVTTEKKRTQNNCSPVKAVSKPSTRTGSHGLQSEEQAKSYLVVTQLFGPTCALLTERQKKNPRYLPAVTDLGGDWKRFASEAGRTGSVCLRVYALF